jgi:hypothetical protein
MIIGRSIRPTSTRAQLGLGFRRPPSLIDIPAVRRPAMESDGREDEEEKTEEC